MLSYSSHSKVSLKYTIFWLISQANHRTDGHLTRLTEEMGDRIYCFTWTDIQTMTLKILKGKDKMRGKLATKEHILILRKKSIPKKLLIIIENWKEQDVRRSSYIWVLKTIDMREWLHHT